MLLLLRRESFLHGQGIMRTPLIELLETFEPVQRAFSIGRALSRAASALSALRAAEESMMAWQIYFDGFYFEGIRRSATNR